MLSRKNDFVIEENQFYVLILRWIFFAELFSRALKFAVLNVNFTFLNLKNFKNSIFSQIMFFF